MRAVKEKVPPPPQTDEPPAKGAPHAELSAIPLSGQTCALGYVEDAPALARAAATLAAQDRLAVDLEADSMYHYRERVCLLQLAVPGHGYLVDPLAVTDLDPLTPIFADHSILKIFHGADYDIRSLYRDYTMVVEPIFDTELAARFLGYTHSGLEAMVKAVLGVDLDKRFQKKDWSRRPLPAAMVEYAARDACYLLPLADALEEALKSKGRLEWVREECALLSRVRPAPDNGNPLFLKFKGAGRLKPRELAVLENLLQFRDRVAARKDRPWFKILGSAPLMALAQKQPQSLKALDRSGVLSRKQMQMYGEDLVACVQAALAQKSRNLPRYPRRRAPQPEPAFAERVQALKNWRDAMAEQLELDGALLCNKALMGQIAGALPSDLEELGQVDGLRKWQLAEFGNQILAVLDKIPARPASRAANKRRRRRRKRIS